MIPVILESPFAADTAEKVQENIDYARACLKDSLLRGEAPMASHLLYTQPGVLDDTVAAERRLGIEAGLSWGALAEHTVVYTDLGITDGMRAGIQRAHDQNRTVLYRSLYT